MDKKNRAYWIWLTIGLAVGAAVGMTIYHRRAGLAEWRMDNKQEILWNLVLKAVSGYLAIVGAIIAACKYLDERAEHSEAALRESKKAFLEKRQQVYFQLGDALADIMNHDPGEDPPDPGWLPAKENFYKLYWGEISLVSEKEVADAVESFSTALHGVETPDQKETLAISCIDIMQKCRKSLGDTWSVDQGDINASGLLTILARFWKPSQAKTASEAGGTEFNALSTKS